MVTPGSDNETTADKLGYQFECVDGTMPEGLTISPTCYSLPPTEELYLTWDDGVTWTQDKFCFRVAVRAIDQAGNESARSNVLIVGNDGDMGYMRQVASGSYSRAANQLATKQLRAFLHNKAASQTDTVRVAAINPASKPPSVTSDVYDDATVRGIEHLQVARIDRTALRQPGKTGAIAFELDPYSLTETGRELSGDEVVQLRELLLDPHSYISDHWMCTSNEEYAFTAGASDARTYVMVSKDCLGVSVTGPGFKHGGELTREAASLLRAYCEGLFELPLLKS
jgi:hypothetical protein